MAVMAAAVGCGDGASDTSESQAPAQEGVDAGKPEHDARASTDGRAGNLPMNHAGGGDAALGTINPIGNTCESLLINAQPNAPEVLIVLDRSGSMIGNNPTKTDRWSPSASVIKEVTAQLDGAMHFGMMMFPDPTPNAVGGQCAVGQLSVPIGAGNARAIAAAIDASPPTKNSATPTAATLQAALGAITSEPACADSCTPPRKYVLLVTDGAPNCGAGGTTTEQSDVDACGTGLDALKADGVTTYVIGYDTAKDAKIAQIMDGFATHGGTEKQLPVEDEASLLSTLTSIAGQLVACDYQLSSEVSDPKFVRVTVDGQQYDLGEGWTLKEDRKTIVLGSACDKLRDARPHALRITLECEQVLAI
ncbi:MAG: glycine-rich protein [Myxococcaceae bacterium]|nr:glycine-rich protein [Myxococcaceae bacterium]